MKIGKINAIGMSIALVITLLDLIFLYNKGSNNLFMFVFGIALLFGIFPFILDISLQAKKAQQITEMFLEFSRNLAESVSTGTPISKSIVNLKEKNYGALSPYVQKLGNQIQIGIPVHQALRNFSYEVDNPVITRAITLISEAEKAGGEIDYILDSAAKSISEVEKLRKERKAAIYSLVVQGYIIFIIFIAIMLVMEFQILPMTAGMGIIGSAGGLSFDANALQNAFEADTTNTAFSPEDMANPFLYLLLAQGFFAGLTIGKLTEGSLKGGLKHSFIMTLTAFLISTGARVFFS